MTQRGRSNQNERGNTRDRKARKAYLFRVYASDVPGFCRCYRCGVLLTVDAQITCTDGVVTIGLPTTSIALPATVPVRPLTVDRIKPGAHGGGYTRENIRPACADCNSTTGGSVRGGIGAPRR